MDKIYKTVKSYVKKTNPEILFVHADLLRGFRLKLKPDEGLLDEHCRLLLGICKNIYMPVFNYDFPKSRIFNVEKDTSQVGVITENFRRNFAKWQTPVPIFSVSGTGEFPEIEDNTLLDPFDNQSVFGHLHRKESVLFYYGANFSSTTFIHYVERVSGYLNYRYDKLFKGSVITKDSEQIKTLKFHVRPMGKKLVYDWSRLENDLLENGLITEFKEKATQIKIINTKEIYDFWIEKMKEDHLYFLNQDSREWVSELLNKLGRKFEISDFETTIKN